MKKLSVKGLADYMTSTAVAQRTIISNYKFPKESGSHAKVIYYKDAKDIIKKYHKEGLPQSWLLSEANTLETEANMLTACRRKTRLRGNAAGVRHYATHFAHRNFEVKKTQTYDLLFDDVIITIYPDLQVIENDKEKLIKLELSKDEPNDKFIKIIRQCLHEAANQTATFKPSQILYFDIPRGKEHRGTRMGQMLTNEIIATCKNISTIWDSIEPTI